MSIAPKVAVVYYSSTGTVHQLAENVARGARQEGAEVRLQSFADMAAVEPVQSTGFADGTGYRAVLELDTEWLPPGAAVPRGLDSRPGVTDLRPHA